MTRCDAISRHLAALTVMLAVAAATLGRIAPAAAQDGLQGFRTPSNNIHCILEDFEPTPQFPVTLRCDMQAIDGPSPPRPRNCDAGWGKYFAIAQNGERGERICVSDSAYGERRVLQYGEVWQAKGFTCRSERTGLTCFNAHQHGFTLSRASQRLF